jgi:hypothetical protein
VPCLADLVGNQIGELILRQGQAGREEQYKPERTNESECPTPHIENLLLQTPDSIQAEPFAGS